MKMNKSLKERMIAPLIEPYARYQNADVLHAMRLGVAVVLALLVNRITKIPHGEWNTVTVFVILGMLQYQGAIYTKAKQRVLGTLLGIVVGVCLLLAGMQLSLFHAISIYYLLIGIISAVIGYFAIKQLGYVGMLTGITMCMVISNANSIESDGLFRALNVLIGTLVSVFATLILPLKSTLMWRFLLANNLEACADLYDGVESHISVLNPEKNIKLLDNTHIQSKPNEAYTPYGKTIEDVKAKLDGIDNNHFKKQDGILLNSSDANNFNADISNSMNNDALSNETANVDKLAEQQLHSHVVLDLGATTATPIDDSTNSHIGSLIDTNMVGQFKKVNQRLLKVRALIAATSSETGIDTQILDQIQRTHRNIIGTIDLLLSAAPKLVNSPIDDDNRILLEHYHKELTQAMRNMAAVLRSPSDEVFRPITRIRVSAYPSIHHLVFDWQGYFWLTQTLQSQLQSLSDLLKETKMQWFKASGLRYQRKEQKRIHAQGGESDLDV